MSPKSFSDPETHFELVVSDTPVTVDGFSRGEPTGEVRCDECGGQHLNIDEIPHAPRCPQRWVRSEWWVEQMQRDCEEES